MKRKMMLLAIMLAPAIFVMTPQSAFAEDNGSYVSIGTDEDAPQVCESVGENCTPYISDGSLIWDKNSKTLILNNYQSIPIGIKSPYEEQDSVEIVLTGENIIRDQTWTETRYSFPNEDGFGSIVSKPTLTISGTGTLNVKRIKTIHLIIAGGEIGGNEMVENNFNVDKAIEINGGKLIVGDFGVPILIMNSGDFIAKQGSSSEEDDVRIGFFVINDGSFDAAEINLMVHWLYLQNGGEVNILNHSRSGRDNNWAALEASYAIFNGGKSSFEGGDFASVMISGPGLVASIDEIQRELDTVNNYLNTDFALPETGFVEFNGGDITINSRDGGHMFGPFAVFNMFNFGEPVAKNAVVFSEKMGTELGEQFQPLAIDYEGEMNLGLFNDGEGEITYSIIDDFPAFEHVATKVHILEKKSDKDESGEEEDINVPNTGAFKQDSGLKAEPIIFAVLAGLSVAFITYKTLRKAE